MLQALIFDVDGTLADTEEAHRAAFNQAFAELGCGWVWDQSLYDQLLAVSGGKERILTYWKQVQPEPVAFYGNSVQDTVDHLHARKTEAYTRAVKDGSVPLRPGVLALIEEAHRAGLSLAIATTTSTPNIAALLEATIGADWLRMFSVVEDASSAPLKKPHPQAYLQVLQRLQLPAGACVALEDSGNGLAAARAAGLATLITPTNYTAQQDFAGALQVLPDMSGLTLAQLREWHAKAADAQAVLLNSMTPHASAA
jgi:HAD superfamily hydrolase (TIGR01509 family)